MRDKITRRAVDAVQSGPRDVFPWDTEPPGFGCKATPKGARISIPRYGRLGRDRRVTSGRHGIDITAEQARLEARDPGSVFHAATGTYSAAYTCDTWTAEGLHVSGIPVSQAGVVFAGQLIDQVQALSGMPR